MTDELRVIPGGLDEPEDPIAAIQATLRKYPQAQVELSAKKVVVLPTESTGFAVTFEDLGGRYRVSCAGWHEDFKSSASASDRFALGLSSACRIKVWRRGGMAHRWQLEVRMRGQWVADGVVGLRIFPFWRRAEIIYLQNHLLEAA
jgi:hypothetical protein